MIRKKVVNQAQLLEEGVAKYFKVSVWSPCPSRLSGGGGPGGQRDQEHGVVLHDQGEGYQVSTNYNFPLVSPSLRKESQILMYLNGIIMVSWADNMCFNQQSQNSLHLISKVPPDILFCLSELKTILKQMILYFVSMHDILWQDEVS